MSISAEWIQLGKGKKGKPIYYRIKEVYEMEWNKDTQYPMNLSDYLVEAAPYGGPIAMMRHPRKTTRMSGPDAGKPYIYVYSSSGRLISKFLVCHNFYSIFFAFLIIFFAITVEFTEKRCFPSIWMV